MAKRNWTPSEDWKGAGEYRGLGETCPRCGSEETEWGVGTRTSTEVSILAKCRVCGLRFKRIAQAEMIDEGCYDADAIAVVEQSDIDE